MIVQTFNNIFETLLVRKLYHLIGGAFLALGIAYLSRWTYISGWLVFALLFHMTTKRIPSSVIAIVLFYLLSDNTFAILGAVVIFTVGDGFAAIIGSHYGKKRLPWHSHKTVLGSVSCFVSATIAMFLLVWSTTDARGWVLVWLSIMPAFIATLIELTPLSPTLEKYFGDNTFIIWGSSLTLLILTTLFSTTTIWN